MTANRWRRPVSLTATFLHSALSRAHWPAVPSPASTESFPTSVVALMFRAKHGKGNHVPLYGVAAPSRSYDLRKKRSDHKRFQYDKPNPQSRGSSQTRSKRCAGGWGGVGKAKKGRGKADKSVKRRGARKRRARRGRSHGSLRKREMKRARKVAQAVAMASLATGSETRQTPFDVGPGSACIGGAPPKKAPATSTGSLLKEVNPGSGSLEGGAAASSGPPGEEAQAETLFRESTGSGTSTEKEEAAGSTESEDDSDETPTDRSSDHKRFSRARSNLASWLWEKFDDEAKEAFIDRVEEEENINGLIEVYQEFSGGKDTGIDMSGRTDSDYWP